MCSLLYVAFSVSLVSSAFSASCENPEVTSISFTNLDATVLTNIAYISLFSVDCGTDNKTFPSLYAELDGAVVPVPLTEGGQYQVSWSEDVKSARRGERIVRIFNEEGSTLLRKVLREGENEAAVPSLFNVAVNHPGAYSGPWFKSEFLAVIISIVVAYVAISTRSKLES